MAHAAPEAHLVTEPAGATPRAWQTVLEHVEGQLLEGTLSVGDHLPGERALSAELGY